MAIIVALAIGVVVLFSAFLLPFVNDTITDQATDSFEVDNNSTEELNDYLSMQINDIYPSNDTVNLTLTDKKTFAENTTDQTEGLTDSIELSGETISITVNSIFEEESVNKSIVTFDYPNTFGWDSPIKALWSELPLLVTIFIVAVVFIILLSVMP